MTSTPAIESLSVVTRADGVSGPPQGQWTYADYAALPLDDLLRYEVMEGVLYMAPAPTPDHQSTSNLLATYLTMHIQFKGLGRVFTAPIDVELPTGDVVQPDVIVILAANLHIISEKRILGAPDLVAEIASPGTASYDRRAKQDAYARAGVREYWLVDPAARTVEVLTLDAGQYRQVGVYAGPSGIASQVLPPLPVRVAQFFS
ncbi:MAG: Uma2 family endonuclease [Chloroflexaceae bacterium]|nr:Uma2 family endonuclease [Chloroflexaceae bacterium]NJO05195.1 Uma2 family endonuclease [Chloroflexaceae bacterium]